MAIPVNILLVAALLVMLKFKSKKQPEQTVVEDKAFLVEVCGEQKKALILSLNPKVALSLNYKPS